MNCVRCNYLLWDLPVSRCPECGLAFDVTDYAFADDVAFICPDCGQSYQGTDEQGLPSPSRFECIQCHHPMDTAHLRVRPLRDGASGVPVRAGTPWEQRRRVGYARAFLDGVARLAMQPTEYFRLSSASHDHGEMVFSVMCAYLAAMIVVVGAALLQGGGLLGGLPDLRLVLRSRFFLLLIAAVPMIQITWNYLYGLLIHAVLAILGQPDSDYESSVRAVAFGSAVLPAVLLLPPVGLLWYVKVVSCGVEQLQHTTKGQALAATLIPILLAGNILLIAGYAVFS